MSLDIKSQRGSGHALIIILVAVVAVATLAYIGLAKKLPGATTSAPTAKITSKADVTAAKDDLNNVSVDKDLDASALNSDVKDLQ